MTITYSLLCGNLSLTFIPFLMTSISGYLEWEREREGRRE